jgi:serralysin
VTQTDGMRQQMLELHNKVRKEHKLHTLDFNSKLQKVAQEHAAHMQKLNQLTHEPNLGKRITEAEYRWGNCAENIAMDGESGSPDVTFNQQWMKSSWHKANILNPDMREVGIGRVSGPKGEWHCVVFAAPQS